MNFLVIFDSGHSSPVHAIIGLAALIISIWMHRRMHGATNDIEEFVQNGVETVASVAIPDRALDSKKYRDWFELRNLCSTFEKLESLH